MAITWDGTCEQCGAKHRVHCNTHTKDAEHWYITQCLNGCGEDVVMVATTMGPAVVDTPSGDMLIDCDPGDEDDGHGWGV